MRGLKAVSLILCAVLLLTALPAARAQGSVTDVRRLILRLKASPPIRVTGFRVVEMIRKATQPGGIHVISRNAIDFLFHACHEI